MNPRQRRGALLMIAATVMAALVFFSIASYVSSVRSQISPQIDVVTLTKPALRWNSVTPDMVKTIKVPRRFAPERSLQATGELAGLVAAANLPVGSVLQQGMLVQPPALRGRERGQTLMLDVGAAVAGRIEPDTLVDVQASYTDPSDSTKPGRTEVVATAVRVIEVGLPRQSSTGTQGNGVLEDGSKSGQTESAQADAPSRSDVSESELLQNSFTPDNDTVPITLALEPEDSLRVGNAIDFGKSIRLVLHRPGDDEPVREQERGYQRGETR